MVVLALSGQLDTSSSSILVSYDYDVRLQHLYSIDKILLYFVCGYDKINM